MVRKGGQRRGKKGGGGCFKERRVEGRGGGGGGGEGEGGGGGGGGHTVPKRGYFPEFHVVLPPVVGYLLKHGLQRGWVTGTPFPPWLHPWTDPNL